MTVYDFSSGFNLLNQGINSLGEALNNRTNAQGYAGIGQAVQQGDWNGAAARAWAMGNPDLAMKLQMQGYAMSSVGNYGAGDGGGAAPASLQPTRVTDTTPGAVTTGPSTGPTGPRAEPTANRFTNTIVSAESAGNNIVSNTDKDSHGLTLAQGGNPREISQGFFQIQNHPGGTWSIYAPKAGVDLAQYPTPQSAPFAVQHAVAQQIPIGQWGPRTIQILKQRFGDFDPHMTLGQVESRFGPAAAAAATGGAQPSAAAPAAAPVAPPAAAPTAAPGPQAQAAPAAPALPQMAQATPPAPIPAAAAAALPAARPAQPAGGLSLASLLGISPAAAGELPPGSGQPGTPPPAAAPPPQGAPGTAIGNAITGAIGGALPQTYPPPRIPPAYGQMPNQPQPQSNALATTNVAPSTYGPGTPAPAAPGGLQQIVQALQSGRVTLRQLAANPQAFGLPDPQRPEAQPVWQALAQAATGGGPGLGAQTPVTAPQTPAPPFAGARATASAGGLQPVLNPPGAPPGYFDRLRQAPYQGLPSPRIPPAYGQLPNQPPAPTPGPSDFGQPPPELSTAAPGADPLADAIAATTGTATPRWISEGVRRLADWPKQFGGPTPPAAPAVAPPAAAAAPQATEEAPLPPRRPADIGKPFPAALPPASVQPKSAANAPIPPSRPPGMGNLPQGVVGYMPNGQPIYAGDPEANLPRSMKGTSAGNLLERAGLAGPAPPPGAGRANWIRPQDTGPYLPAGLQPGAGAAPAALPPGAGGAPAAPPGGGAPLGGALSGLGGGLLNMMSMTPPGGVPGMNTPAQFLQGGQGAPLPAPPWLQRPPGAVLPQPTPAGLQPGAGAQPAGLAPGAPAAPADAIDQQIAAATQRMQAMRQQAIRVGIFNPELAKLYEAEASGMQTLVNNLTEKKAEAGLKPGEVATTTSGEMAKEGMKTLETSYANVMSPGGPMGLIRNIDRMKADLPNAIAGWGPFQKEMEDLGASLAAVNMASQGKVAAGQEFNALAAQETLALSKALVAPNRLNRQEFQSLKDSNMSLAQQPRVAGYMLDLARQRADQMIDTHNESVKRFGDAYPEYGKAAGTRFTVSPEQIQKYTAQPAGASPQGVAGEGASRVGGAGAQTPGAQTPGAQAPVRVASPAEAMKLPPGTLILLPDGRIGTVPGRQ